jgi:hypothetical protein
MKRLIQPQLAGLLICMAATHAQAQAQRINRGHDPFFQISKAISECPAPLGPLEIERGNSCWVEGRCRLSNAYLYDAEIADAVQRRLTNINYATHWREQSTLWLTLQRRFIYVQGCVAPGFDKQTFLSELAKTADVDRVIDDTTANPHAASLPYKTLADPDKAVIDPGN